MKIHKIQSFALNISVNTKTNGNGKFQKFK